MSPATESIVITFARLSRALNQPTSVGKVYGVLFAEREGLTAQQIQGTLQLSKPVVLSALSYLQTIQFVHAHPQATQRAQLWKANTAIKPLVEGLLQTEVLPTLREESERQLQATQNETNPQIKQRAKHLEFWLNKAHGHLKKAQHILPWI